MKKPRHEKTKSSDKSSMGISNNNIGDLSSKSIHHGTPMNISSIPNSGYDDDSFLETMNGDLFVTKNLETNDMMSDPIGAMSPKFGEEKAGSEKDSGSDFSHIRDVEPQSEIEEKLEERLSLVDLHSDK